MFFTVKNVINSTWPAIITNSAVKNSFAPLEDARKSRPKETQVTVMDNPKLIKLRFCFPHDVVTLTVIDKSIARP